METRLAVVLAADVVGYARLIGADEAGTLGALKRLRRTLIEPLAARFHGRTFKLMGDGALMDFSSAVEAVQFAVAAQARMQEEPPAIRYRIGIHLGEVVVEGDDLYGDSVNVAARLEQMAEPGGICISGAVHGQVRGRLDLHYEALGPVRLKNIAEPVPAWRVAVDERARRLGQAPPEQAAAPPPARRRPPRWATAVLAALALAAPAGWYATRAPERAAAVAGYRPAVAVLPFDNLSGSESDSYFSDGITEDLITDLAKIPDLFVIARNSSFAYKGQFADIREIADDLGARYIVEGSVRRAGDTIRITAQLTDAEAGRSIWAERYDRAIDDIFQVQDEVREQIATALAVKVDPSLARLNRRDRISVEAYDLLLQGIAEEGSFTDAANLRAREFYRQVVALEPDFAEGHARLATTYDMAGFMGWASARAAALEVAERIAREALSLNPLSPYAHWTLGRIATHLGNLELARESIEKAIELAPNYADAIAYLSLIHSYFGDAGKGLAEVDRALALNPIPPFWYHYARGLALYLLGRDEEAATDLARAVEGNPTVPWARHFLIAVHARLGDLDEAAWQMDELAVAGFPVTLSAMMARSTLADAGYRARFEADLRSAGVPE